MPTGPASLETATTDEVYRLVRQLRDADAPLPSRNRAYDAMSRPAARRAWRIHQRLRGIERELREGAEVSVIAHVGGYRVRLSFPTVRVWREAYLTREEHALLCADPALAPLLAARSG